MKNNQVFVSYLFFYITVNLCLFISRAIQYRESNGFVIIARGCGEFPMNLLEIKLSSRSKSHVDLTIGL